jgi:hypothetical protein
VAVLKNASFESNGVQASMSFVRFASGGEGEREGRRKEEGGRRGRGKMMEGVLKKA